MVECQLPKLDVAGSSPVSRSMFSITWEDPKFKRYSVYSVFFPRPGRRCISGRWPSREHLLDRSPCFHIGPKFSAENAVAISKQVLAIGILGILPGRGAAGAQDAFFREPRQEPVDNLRRGPSPAALLVHRSCTETRNIAADFRWWKQLAEVKVNGPAPK